LIPFIHDRAQLSLWEREGMMATYLAFHEVDDVDHWLTSPKREEVFGPLGITTRTFKDSQGSKRVGLIVEIPDFAAFQEFMQTEPALEAMKHDGVHPDSLVILAEG
jgi:hypothetical protein